MRPLKSALFIGIGFVWLINGLLCKVLGLVPRHQQIVERILGPEHASEITIVIGLGEIFLAIWFWSGIKARWNAVLQIALVAVMNILEFVFARDLLLWGGWNVLFASGFIVLVFIYEFVPTRVDEETAAS